MEYTVFLSNIFKPMETTRQKKVGRLIQKELAVLFQREFPHMLTNTLISVNTVRMSPDLGLAKVYLSAIGEHKADLIKKVNLEHKTIRHALAKSIRNQVRVVPELAFFNDDTLEYATRIDDILSNLEIPPAPDAEEDEDEEDDY